MNMDGNFVTNILFPFALFMVMFRVGLSLDLEHLNKAVKNKKPIILGLTYQMILLPLLGFLLVHIFQFPLEIGLGIMIITVCPGGWISNLLSTHLKADVNLSIALTTFSSLLCVFTTPFYLYLALMIFYPNNDLDFSLILTSGKISLWVVVPALIGLIIHYKNIELSAKILKMVRPTSIIFIVLIVVGAAIKEGEHFSEYFREIGVLLFLLNALITIVSFYTAKFIKCKPTQPITIAVETGVQNSTLAIVMAMSIMGDITMAIPPTIYTLIMFGTVSFLLFFYKRKNRKSQIN